MNWRMKALIGATGGIALVLLKLIEVQFFVDDFWSKKALAAYLTYGAYVLLGVIVAVFFTDDTLEDAKIRRSAFFAGLLAPSILLAVIRQPGTGQPADLFRQGPAAIPKIGLLLLGEAHAQAPAKAPAVPDEKSPVPVIELKKADIESGFADGFKTAIGRSDPPKSYVFVLGEAESKEKALAVAEDVNKVLWKQVSTPGTSAYVMRPEGGKGWFVTVGKFDAPVAALGFRQAAQDAAIKSLTSATAAPLDKSAAKLMLEGKIVNGKALFEKW